MRFCVEKFFRVLGLESCKKALVSTPQACVTALENRRRSLSPEHLRALALPLRRLAATLCGEPPLLEMSLHRKGVSLRESGLAASLPAEAELRQVHESVYRLLHLCLFQLSEGLSQRRKFTAGDEKSLPSNASLPASLDSLSELFAALFYFQRISRVSVFRTADLWDFLHSASRRLIRDLRGLHSQDARAAVAVLTLWRGASRLPLPLRCEQIKRKALSRSVPPSLRKAFLRILGVFLTAPEGALSVKRSRRVPSARCCWRKQRSCAGQPRERRRSRDRLHTSRRCARSPGDRYLYPQRRFRVCSSVSRAFSSKYL